MASIVNSDEKAPAYEERDVKHIDPQIRRSMEDEESPLPEGWIRQWDPESKHHFYVDTKANPPRTIWNHPYEDREWLESQGHHVPGSDTEDEADAPGDSKAKSRGLTPSPNRGESSRGLFHSGNQNINTANYAVAPGPADMNFQTHGRTGIIGGIISLIFGDTRYRARQQQDMEYRYAQRRNVFQQNGGNVPPNMAGPMYPGGGMMYAPPLMPFNRLRERHIEREMRHDERRLLRSERKAIRRGYAVPVLTAPEFGQAPLFGYANGPGRW